MTKRMISREWLYKFPHAPAMWLGQPCIIIIEEVDSWQLCLKFNLIHIKITSRPSKNQAVLIFTETILMWASLTRIGHH